MGGKGERHGMYWRNAYGSYYHGRWVPMKQECCGCVFWGFLVFLAFTWFFFHYLPSLAS
jgi:hypothetical protein